MDCHDLMVSICFGILRRQTSLSLISDGSYAKTSFREGLPRHWSLGIYMLWHPSETNFIIIDLWRYYVETFSGDELSCHRSPSLYMLQHPSKMNFIVTNLWRYHADEFSSFASINFSSIHLKSHHTKVFDFIRKAIFFINSNLGYMGVGMFSRMILRSCLVKNLIWKI